MRACVRSHGSVLVLSLRAPVPRRVETVAAPRAEARARLQVRIEAAFGTLRKSASVDDAIDWNTLQKVRDLGKGSYGTVGLYRWKPGTTRVDHTGEAVPRMGEVRARCPHCGGQLR